MKNYRFYGHEHADATTSHPDYPGIHTPYDMYDALSELWCASTCAPRMRADWSPENKTYGQCSITSFLVQDLFGGKVYGIPLPEGGYHCYNVVGECLFDLTSEQFGDVTLCYENNPEQFRSEHFADADKKARYELLKQSLLRYCADHSEK